MKKQIILSIIALLTVSISIIAQSNQNPTKGDDQFYLGLKYYQANNFSKATYWWLKAAQQGVVAAQYNLAMCYDNGQGVTRDYYEANKWYRKAAENGYSEAQVTLGARYMSGKGITRDPAQAVKWLTKAAEQGNADGQYNLALCYGRGDGVAKNEVLANYWLKKAADQGHAEAKRMMGGSSKIKVSVPLH